jgi:hypothetical protein
MDDVRDVLQKELQAVTSRLRDLGGVFLVENGVALDDEDELTEAGAGGTSSGDDREIGFAVRGLLVERANRLAEALDRLRSAEYVTQAEREGWGLEVTGQKLVREQVEGPPAAARALPHRLPQEIRSDTLSTNAPALVRRLHGVFAARGAHVLDAPVSGGPVGARTRRLAIWVGGERALFERYRAVLEAMGDQPYYVG